MVCWQYNREAKFDKLAKLDVAKQAKFAKFARKSAATIEALNRRNERAEARSTTEKNVMSRVALASSDAHQICDCRPSNLR